MWRIEGPVKGDFRLAKKPTQVGGVDIPAGAFLYIANSAANRDPRRFETPGEFQVDRDNARLHLASGRGRPTCPRAPPARAETELATSSRPRTGGSVRQVSGVDGSFNKTH